MFQTSDYSLHEVDATTHRCRSVTVMNRDAGLGSAIKPWEIERRDAEFCRGRVVDAFERNGVIQDAMRNAAGAALV